MKMNDRVIDENEWMNVLMNERMMRDERRMRDVNEVRKNER